MPVIGFLGLLTPEEFTLPATGYIQGLSQAGYVDGQNVKMNIDGRTDNSISCRRSRPIWFDNG